MQVRAREADTRVVHDRRVLFMIVRARRYTCDATSNQFWLPSGKTFSEHYRSASALSLSPLMLPSTLLLCRLSLLPPSFFLPMLAW